MKRAVPYVTEGTLDSAAARWLTEVGSLVRPRPQLRLEVSRCALLVIDLVRYFAAPGGRAYLPASSAVVPKVTALLETFRAKGAPVAFTRHGHDGPEDLGMLGRFYSDYIREGEEESQLIGALQPRAGEPVMRKRTYDAFVGTPLEAWLREKGAGQVLVTGVLTHLCCETTARSAFVRGFEVFVAADATASTTERLHLGSLLSLADGFAAVVTSGEVGRCAR
ncbi:MAG: isochorismatase family protein [Myxococcaceae bacterium]